MCSINESQLRICVYQSQASDINHSVDEGSVSKKQT